MQLKLNLIDSLDRVKAATINQYGLSDMAEWIQKHLRLQGRPISFDGREYQKRILESTAPTVVVKKCSQVGLSELMLMRNLALMIILDGFKIIHTLPTAVFAQKVMKTRVDPLIQGSDLLSSRLNRDLDNASVKNFGNSFLYLSGTNTDNAVISVPADAISVDELDFSDLAQVEKLQSRLTASAYRWWSFVSTPTVPLFGIDNQFQASKRHYNFCKCVHCNKWFYPSYLEHLKIPGYTGDLLKITKQDLGTLRWREAEYLCPYCNKPVDLSIEHRDWVVENPLDKFESDGFQVSPTDAPKIISGSDLVLWSTRFSRKVNFVNYHLGLVQEDEDSGLNNQDLELMTNVGRHSLHGFKVFGLDIGTVCHLTVGVTNGQGKLTVIDLIPIHYTQLEEELQRLIRIYRPVTIVSDSQPYVETIHRLQQKIHNLYGSVYITSKNLAPFTVIDKAEDTQKTILPVRQVNVNRNFSLNALMSDIRAGNIGIKEGLSEYGTFCNHLKDMKRAASSAAIFTGDANTEADSYAWVKTTGNDHYHHSLLYTHVASQMVHHLPQSGGGLPVFLSTFRLK